ncbi:hypothetical protein FOZ63_007983 [Perkinsus olseni]|uniref:Universal minicircle sequence binding protein n=1 Tax=Perkinsus olseni TaxID=32597 RepID=A0A7J6RMW3_PEROL|nr:hypothetical protein FOZ63_007983 [Perkinsus olseni]
MVRRGKASKEDGGAKQSVIEKKKGIKRSRKGDDIGDKRGKGKGGKGALGKGKRRRESKREDAEDSSGRRQAGDSSTCSTTTAASTVEGDEIKPVAGGEGPLFFEDSQGDSDIDTRIQQQQQGQQPKYQGKWRAVPPTRYYSESDGNFEAEVRSAEEIRISSHGDKNYPGFKHHVEACSICGSEDHSGRCFGRRCNACFKEGHLMKDCPVLLQDRRRCNLCGQLGHLRKDCVLLEYRRTLGLNTSSHGCSCNLECIACGGIHTDGTLNCSPCPRMKTLWCTRCGDTGHHAWECEVFPMGVKVAQASSGGRGHHHHGGKGGGGRRNGKGRR